MGARSRLVQGQPDMTNQPPNRLTPLQRTLLETAGRYPGRFHRSELAKMLAGVRSWPDKEMPEYGRLARYGRKELTNQIDILLQQGYLELDWRNRLLVAPATNSREEEK
jgi:hypothetical protein